MQAERIERWAGWRSSPRRASLEPLVGDLVDARVPEWPGDDILGRLLDKTRPGPALTERGAVRRDRAAAHGVGVGQAALRSEADAEMLRGARAGSQRLGTNGNEPVGGRLAAAGLL